MDSRGLLDEWIRTETVLFQSFFKAVKPEVILDRFIQIKMNEKAISPAEATALKVNTAAIASIVAIQGELPDSRCLDRLALQWYKFGYPMDILQNHRDAVEFLKKSKLLFALRAYQISSHDSELQKGICFDQTDRAPMILMNHAWQRVDAIRQQFETDGRDISEELVDAEGAKWNYSTDGGLLPIGWKFNLNQPAHHLSIEEMERLRTSVNNQGEGYYLQVFTSEGDYLPHHPLFRNLNQQIGGHTAGRLIMANGDVFSFGYENAPGKLREEVFGCLPFSFFTTVNGASPSNIDYSEFRSFSRRIVTTLPISKQQAEDSRQLMHRIADANLGHFCFSKLNCADFMQNLLIYNGHNVEFRTHVGAVMLASLPNLEDIPYIGRSLARVRDVIGASVERIGAVISQPLKTLAGRVSYCLLFIPHKLVIFCRNLFYMMCGMCSSRAPLTQVQRAAAEGLPEAFRPFERRISSFWDLFDDEPGFGAFSPIITAWQRTHQFTVEYSYQDHRPQFCIVPPTQELL